MKSTRTPEKPVTKKPMPTTGKTSPSMPTGKTGTGPGAVTGREPNPKR